MATTKKNNLANQVCNTLYSICVLKLNREEMEELRSCIFSEALLKQRKELIAKMQYTTMLRKLWRKNGGIAA